MSPSSPTSAATRPLVGKVALVTGASRGIGRAIAVRLAHDGAVLALAARDAKLLREVADEIRAAGGRAEPITLDLRKPETAGQLVSAALRAFGGIDIVVNNAGATKRGDFFKLTDADWADGYALKLFGAVRLARESWPSLKERRGSLLNIAGVGGRTPGPDFTIGGSVNAAVLAFTKAIADVGVRDGVQVNAVNPGYIRTARLQARLEAAAKDAGVNVDQAAQRMVVSNQIVRLGEPEDVANLVAFIVSPAGRFLQGSLIDLDGGQTKSL